MLEYGNALSIHVFPPNYIILKGFGKSVFTVTVHIACSMHHVSPLLAVYW